MKNLISYIPEWKVFFQASIVFIVPYFFSKTFKSVNQAAEQRK
ncbi:hypothetical protein [Cytobacillus dafuensis]|nr:hypothetical protein [Cytobacillus dafuensis]